MYSGDEFYGDEITSPVYEHPARYPEFESWLQRLNKIVWKRVGCSLDDLEDFNTLDGFEDGLTPSQFYREYIAPEIGEE